MKIVVTGASGFIGSAVVAALRAEGCEVLAASHRDIDLAHPAPERWRSALAGADALVNCAGLFAAEAGHDLEAVNASGAAALFAACEAAGVRRVVQLSALGAEHELSAFARSKRAAERALEASGLDWVILRPSIVFGDRAAGGSALLRGLAGLPVAPVDRASGDLQIVQLDDVVRTVLFFIRPGAPARLTLDLVGPERLSFADNVQAIRAWLGWKPAPVLRLPSWLMAIGFALGDLAGWLRWRTPIRSGARAELSRGAVGDPGPWARAVGFQPQGLRDALRQRPASPQERLYAAMYFQQPFVIGVTALFFVGTGIVSVGPGYEIGVALLQQGGVGKFSGPSVIAGGVADFLAGLAIAWRPTVRWGLYAAIALSLFYFVAGTLLLPGLWRDPIGPMLKIWPLIALNLAALAMVRGR